MEQIFIKTFGCSQNQTDSEIMAGFLIKSGFKIVKSEDESDLVVVNSCTVKQPTENKILKYINSVNDMGKKIVVAGCLGQTDPGKLEGFSIIGTSQLENIVEIVEETLNNNTMCMIVNEKINKVAMPKARFQKNIEIIPISSGCLGDCAYCVVKFARGKLNSYPKNSILSRVKKAVDRGTNQIWITSQDNGCYGMDQGNDYLLPELLRDIVKIPGDYKIRIGMMNPNHLLTYLDRMIKLFDSDKLYKFIHIPVQSGNDEILKKMKRKYSVDDFKRIIRKIRETHPDMTIATDIICGFPGETNDQFMDSIRLIRDIMPDVVNRSRFWTRPKTEAESMPDQIPSSEIKQRSRFLSSEFERVSYERNKAWIKWEGSVYPEGYGKNNTTVCRNYAYKPIIVDGKKELERKIRVKIIGSTIYDLRSIEKK